MGDILFPANGDGFVNVARDSVVLSLQRLVDIAHRRRSALYVVVGLCALIGVFEASVAAWYGDLLGVLVGVAIGSGAVAVGVLLHVTAALAGRLLRVEEDITELRGEVGRLQRNDVVDETRAAAFAAGSLGTVDLAALGSGDPSAIVAATLGRDGFPRLARAVDERPPSFPPWQGGMNTVTRDTTNENVLTADEGLHRVWTRALEREDLATCRSVWPALCRSADRATVSQLAAELTRLSARKEAALRKAFAERVRVQDFAGALAVGQEITSVLPRRPIAADFKRLKPLLLRRVKAIDRESAARTPCSRTGA